MDDTTDNTALDIIAVADGDLDYAMDLLDAGYLQTPTTTDD